MMTTELKVNKQIMTRNMVTTMNEYSLSDLQERFVPKNPYFFLKGVWQEKSNEWTKQKMKFRRLAEELRQLNKRLADPSLISKEKMLKRQLNKIASEFVSVCQFLEVDPILFDQQKRNGKMVPVMFWVEEEENGKFHLEEF